MKLDLLNTLRTQNPLVVNVANFITAVDVANGLNAIGASPIMTESDLETEQMAEIANSICLNMGAFTQPQIKEIRDLGRFANAMEKPVVFDPVAVGALKIRTHVAKEFFHQFNPTIIRGNAGEIAALADIDWSSRGIDAGSGTGDLNKIAQACSKKYECVVILSGKWDYITDGSQTTIVKNGTELFQLHVGSGDMLSSLAAAFAAIEPNYYEAAQSASLIFAAIGQIVASKMQQAAPASFGVKLIDAMHLTTVEQIQEVADYEQIG